MYVRTCYDGNFSNDIIIIDNVEIKNGDIDYMGGGMMAYSYDNGQITVVNSTFTGNAADYAGGMNLVSHDNGQITVSNSTFVENSATNYGGAIQAQSYSTSQIILLNNTFIDNDAPYGGGMYAKSSDNSQITVVNSTFTGNTADYGGGMYAYLVYFSSRIHQSYINIINNIFEGASNGGGIYLSKDLENSGEFTVNYNGFSNNKKDGVEDQHLYYDSWYSDPSEFTEFEAIENLICNPMFADDDLRLGEASSCINEGPATIDEFSEEVRDLVLHDKDGTLRPQGPAFDIGAYEIPFL